MDIEMSSFVRITSQDFVKYPHGIAYLSSIDGRGNFIAFSIFKMHGTGRNGRKRLYTFVALLCNCGGEFRDGFLKENVTENDILSIVQCYLQTAHRQIPLVKVSADDVSGFVIKFCFDKFLKKKMQYPSKDVQTIVELFRRANKYTIYKTASEYLVDKFGETRKAPRYYYLDHRRREFQSWWMERTEFERNNLPLPYPPFYETDGKVLTCVYINKLNKKLTTEENYERFSGMARHMGFWYLHSRKPLYLKLAATMFEAHDKIMEKKRNGKSFDTENPVLMIIVARTQIILNQQGYCEGQTPRSINLATTRSSCNMCGAAVEKGMADNDLTCINKEGEAGLGNEMTREVLTIMFHDVKKVGVPMTAVRSVRRVFEQAFFTFFTHCFKTHVYWKETPTPPMIDKLAVQISLHLLRMIIINRNADWREVLSSGLPSLIRSICGPGLSDQSINTVCTHFSNACNSIKNKNCRNNQTNRDIVKQSLNCKIHALAAYVNGPSIGTHMNLRWKYMSETRRKELLECDPELINQALLSVYTKTTAIVIEKLNSLKTAIVKKSQQQDGVNSDCKESVKKQLCGDSECPCHLFSRFKDYFFMVLPSLTEDDDSLLKWVSSQSDGDDTEIEEDLKEKEKKKPNHEDENDDIGGKVMLNHALFLQDNNLLSETISGDENALADNIDDFYCDSLTDDCPLLNVITNAVYLKLFTATATKIMQQFNDVPLMEEYCPSSEEYYRPTCAGCEWEEDANDRFLMCGGCKSVYYCSKDCQKRHQNLKFLFLYC